MTAAQVERRTDCRIEYRVDRTFTSLHCFDIASARLKAAAIEKVTGAVVTIVEPVRCGDIGDDPKTYEFEPFVEPAIPEPSVPPQPVAPAPQKEPVPA